MNDGNESRVSPTNVIILLVSVGLFFKKCKFKVKVELFIGRDKRQRTADLE